MEIEVWKPISNFNKYEVSNFGNIRNSHTKKILVPCEKGGYLCVSLIGDNKERKSLKMHRIIAQTFIDNTENKETVNHKDHNKLNNNVKNLEWATVTEQNNHKRKCEKERLELVSARAIWRVDLNTEEKIELYETIKFASEWVFNNKLTSITDFNNGNNIKTKICAVARGKRNNAFGYKWIYDDTNENKYIGEEWKDIPANLIGEISGYQISNFGRVKNHKGRISEGSKHGSGYLWISINPKQYLLHRLVAKVFVPNPENKSQVNHIDGNKENAKANNLEWCNNKENSQHAHDIGLHNNEIIQYDLNMNEINRFQSQKHASDKLNISYSIIHNSIKKAKAKNGFIYKIANG